MNTKEVIDRIFKEPGVQFELREVAPEIRTGG